MDEQTPTPNEFAAGTVFRAGWANTFDRAAFAILVTALIWAPWPLGSNRPWALALLGGLLGSALFLVVLAHLSQPPAPLVRNKAAGWWIPLVGLLGFTAILVLQMVPGLGTSTATISIDPFQTRRYLLATLVYLSAWGLVLLTARTPKRATHVLGAIVVAGVLQAAVAVVLASTGWRYELWFVQFEQGGRATGTFVNPDHLAGYMELTLSAGLGWLLSQFTVDNKNKGRGWQASLLTALRFALSPKMLLRLMLMAAVVALVMTHSRMGNGAFFLALFAVGALVAWRSQRLRRPALWMVASMALVDLIIIGQWVGLDRVVQRIQETRVSATTDSSPTAAFGETQGPHKGLSEQTLEQRLEVPRQTLQLVAARPWLGHGGGSYVTAFPPYKDDRLEGTPLQWDHAHNDYVQVAADTGLLGLALWLVAGLATAWRALSLLRDKETDASRGLAVSALMALLCLGLHSMVDFNLHIPANALTFSVLLALVWTAPRTHKRSPQKPRSARLKEGA